MTTTTENQALDLEPIYLNVADFRDEINLLFDVVNRDYHSCVGLGEYKSFHGMLKRVFDRVALVACKRAKPRDTQRYDAAIQAAIRCFHKSSERIAELEKVKAGIRTRAA